MEQTLYAYIIRALLATLIGGLIGLERELQGKSAGMRTNMLICLGSCLIMIISVEVATTCQGVADPGRIAAQVVTGIGFLGAGTIIRSRFHVTGLTTAATIWVLSAIGLTIGAGHLLLAVCLAAIITIVLTLVKYLENAISRSARTHNIEIKMSRKIGVIGLVMESFSRMKVPTERLYADRSGERWYLSLEYTASPEKHRQLINEISSLEEVLEVTEF